MRHRNRIVRAIYDPLEGVALITTAIDSLSSSHSTWIKEGPAPIQSIGQTVFLLRDGSRSFAIIMKGIGEQRADITRQVGR